MAAGPKVILSEMEQDTWRISMWLGTGQATRNEDEAKKERDAFVRRYRLALDYAPGTDCLDQDQWVALSVLMDLLDGEQDLAKVKRLVECIRSVARSFGVNAEEGSYEQIMERRRLAE